MGGCRKGNTYCCEFCSGQLLAQNFTRGFLHTLLSLPDSLCKMVKAMKAMKAVAAMKAMKKGSDSGTLGKGKLLKRPAAAELTKANLKKALGKGNGDMTLDEKVQHAATFENEDEGAQWLKDNVTKLENSKLWSRHRTHLNKEESALEKENFDKAAKKEKGMASALWAVG